MNDNNTGLEALGWRLSEWLDQADALAAGRSLGRGDASDRPTREQLELINEHLERRVKERAGLLRVLHDITAIVNESRTINAAFRRVLKRVAEHNGWSFGHVYLVSRHDPDVLVRTRAHFEESPGRIAAFVRMSRARRLRRGERLPGKVLETGEPAWSTDLAKELAEGGIQIADPAVWTAAAFPVKIEGDVLAVFEFMSNKEILPDRRILDSMATIGTHLGLFIVRKRMKRKIAELTTMEQQRIGRDLHDDLGQQLTGVALLAKSLERDLHAESSPHAQRVAEIARGLKEAQTHVRLLARGLVPVALDGKGLMKALADLARDSSRRFEIDVRFVPKVETLVRNNETATELYRIAQEAVTNAAKHGRAKQITITLSIADENINLEILDNGIGVSDETIRRLGVGMSTMVYRANVMGGELAVERAPEGGTMVRCSVSSDDESADWEYTRDD